MNNDEAKVSLLREWMRDPARADELMKMSVEARNELLSQAVLANKKEYRLEDASEQVAFDKAGDVAKSVAENSGGRGNVEIGVIQKDGGEYSVTEEQTDGTVNVITPRVHESKISYGGGVVSYSSSNGDNSNKQEPHLEQIDLQQRELLSGEFYIGIEDMSIYGNNGYVGVLDQTEFWLNEEDNYCLYQGENRLGVVKNVEEVKQRLDNVSKKSKPNMKVLRKTESYSRSAAFVSLPVIMFVLSAMLLIGSIILLFVLD